MKFFRPSLTLLLFAILAYGLLIPQLGFYWDDLPISWIRYQLGSQALTQYFSTNRPVWGLLYQLTTSIFPYEPIYWQIFALIWRWLGAVVLFAIVDTLWKGKPRLALGTALLFLVYPGFNQQWASFLYSHFFIVLFFFLYSYLCTLWAFEEPAKFKQWTTIAIVFSALNLWMMEYFYVLEFMRVGVILTMLRHEPLSIRERVMKTFKLWLPYLGVLILAVLSRLFIFNNQVYGIGLTSQLKSAPLETLIQLARTIRATLYLVLRSAWVQVTQLPELHSAESILNNYYWVVAIAVLVGAIGFWALPRKQANQNNFVELAWMFGLGCFAVLLAGWPFWLVGFEPSLAWPASRFTLPFMFGASLIFASVIDLLPWRPMRIVIFLSLASLAAGYQFLLANNHQQDWQTHKEFFWQLHWRAPGIQPDTAILMNEGAFEYYADNSLAPVVNWIYAPNKRGEDIDYVLLFPTNRVKSETLPSLEPDQPIRFEYLAGEFMGNTSQVLAFYYAPPNCLRLLDPEIDRLNRTIPENSLMRFASRLSQPSLILSEELSVMPKPYAPEPVHGWCYYFQRADLARQFDDWDEVVRIAEIALQMERPSNEPEELFVFIEGYAQVGEWDRALELSTQAFQESSSDESLRRMLCQLWERVGVETALSAERSEALSGVTQQLSCAD